MSADYAMYLKLNDWTGLAAVCLLAGIDPQKYAKRLKNIHTKPTAKNLDLWNRVIDPINRAFMQSEADSEIIARIDGEAGRYYDPVKVINWAIAKDFDVPDELRAFAERYKPKDETATIDKPTRNAIRNQIASKWIASTNTNLDDLYEMRNSEIIKALELFSPDNKSLFTTGGNDWLNRDHTVIPARTAGHKSKK